MRSEAVEQYWRAFCLANSVDVAEPYQVWHFGNTSEMAVELAALVLAGKKTATASSQNMNELQPDEAPQPEGYSVVTDFAGDPLCVIQTVEIAYLPFDEVDAAFAADEGEGDLSLTYWRRVHRDYFGLEAERHGFEFTERSVICCERFRVLFTR